MIVDTLHAEAMVRVRVGYGTAVDKLQDIPKSYQEAKMALEVGNIFYVESETICLRETRNWQTDLSASDEFMRDVHCMRSSGNASAGYLDDEIIVTIQKFFENNLNISETARQLICSPQYVGVPSRTFTEDDRA